MFSTDAIGLNNMLNNIYKEMNVEKITQNSFKQILSLTELEKNEKSLDIENGLDNVEEDLSTDKVITFDDMLKLKRYS